VRIERVRRRAPGEDKEDSIVRGFIHRIASPPRSRAARAGLACLALVALDSAAQTPAYPSKPMRIVVPYPASGPTDVTARLLAQKLIEASGRPVIVDNRPGAGGIIGCEIAVKATPDGHTLLIMPTQIAINPALYDKIPFDTLKDLAAITQLTTQPYLLAAPVTAPFRTVQELIALAKAKPGELRCASSGIGGGNHLACELFNKMAGTRITHIPYKGAAPALIDTMAGRVEMYMPNPITALKQVEAGKLRALAFTSAKRVAMLPELPTVAEALPGFEAGVWMGLFTAAATPAPVVQQIYRESARILQLADVRKSLTSQGGEIVASAPEQFSAFMRAEVRKWSELVKLSGAKAE
jgi:tripartite-type tricarboxylate transporter receptor subunit TctC